MICDKCKVDFPTKTYNQKYCSKKCYVAAKRLRHFRRKIVQKLCEFCKKEFETYNNASYCSNSCMSKATAHKRKKFVDIPSCLNEASRKLDKKLGYVRVYVPMHPEANTWGYVYEHRIVAEKIIGRRLDKDEIVHHKNGKRWDNRPENLEVMSKSEHAKLHGQRERDLNI
jgi:hypothetical protein